MEPNIKENLLWTVFDHINTSTVKCKLCSIEMTFIHYDKRFLFLHIQIDHQSLWHASLFLPNAMSPLIWLKLFNYARIIDNILILNSVECRFCDEQFNFESYSQLPNLLNHVKASHPLLLLALSLLYTEI